jgi:hypothetical protein
MRAAPWVGVAVIGAGLVVASFAFGMFQARG